MADFPVVLPSARISRLNDIERINGYNAKFTIGFADVAVAAATGSTDTVTFTIGTTPTSWLVDKAYANVTTAFANTGGLTLQSGSAGTTTAFLPATSCLTAGVINASGGINTVNTVASSKSTTQTTMVVVFTNSISGSPSAVNAGSVDVFLSIRDMA